MREFTNTLENQPVYSTVGTLHIAIKKPLAELELWEMVKIAGYNVNHMGTDVSHMGTGVSHMGTDVSHISTDVSHMGTDVSHKCFKCRTE